MYLTNRSFNICLATVKGLSIKKFGVGRVKATPFQNNDASTLSKQNCWIKEGNCKLEMLLFQTTNFSVVLRAAV